jgi:6-pyruvoyltetrahydropterin/6-carboxytetrahydropterin synthase
MANTYAAWPSTDHLAAYFELTVTCRAPVDPVSGYMMNITEIDRAVRDHALPRIERAVAARRPALPTQLLPELVDCLRAALNDSVHAVTWRLTPFHTIHIDAAAMDRYIVSQQFSFAAAHRLHCPTMSDAENHRVFGKCNNANGHGHNYRLEVAVSQPIPGPGAAPAVPLPELERIVDERVVRRFDHTHLNLDTEEFADLNPSVEHIAKICHDLLHEAIAAAGGRLERVTVWETEKTSCTYPVPGPAR